MPDGPLDVVRTAGPTSDPVDLDEFKAHLRIEPSVTDEDPLLQRCLDAALANLDGRAGILGRALISQAWTLYLDAFPPRRIELPLAPLISVASITYKDQVGATQTVPSGDYVVLAGEAAAIEPAWGKCWAAARRQPRSVAVAFVAGYGTDPEDVPAAIRAAQLMIAADLKANTEATVIDASRVTVVVNPTVDRLLKPYRATRVA